MSWKISATLNFIAMLLTATGTVLAGQSQTQIIGVILIAVAAGITASANYLLQQGVITATRK